MFSLSEHRYLCPQIFWTDCDDFNIFEEETFLVLLSSVGTVAVQRRLLQTEEMVRRITLCHCFLFPVRLRASKLTWTWSCWRPSSPRELQGPGKLPVLSSLKWHCNAKRNRLAAGSMKTSGTQKHQVRCETGSWSYMISMSSQWELAGISSNLAMWRPMGRLSVWMQRQCCSTPRLLRLIPVRRQPSQCLEKCNVVFFQRCKCKAG